MKVHTVIPTYLVKESGIKDVLSALGRFGKGAIMAPKNMVGEMASLGNKEKGFFNTLTENAKTTQKDFGTAGTLGDLAVRGAVPLAVSDRLVNPERYDAYESDVDVPKPILDKPIEKAFTDPLNVARRLSRDGETGDTGLGLALGAQAGGAVAGGALGRAALTSGKLGKTKGLGVAGATLGSLLGLGSGGAAANLLHNSESKDQFAKALKGSIAEEDMPKIPKGILALLDQGNTDKFKEMAPRFLPELMDRPYIQELLATQTPR